MTVQLGHDDHTEVLFVFAIIGHWEVGTELNAEDLVHIAGNVRQQPEFVRGYWGQETDSSEHAHAVALFEDQASASAMAEGITAAIPSASLIVVRVLAEA